MYKILLIEDESAYIEILKDTFKKAAFEVATATDGRKGVIEAAKVKPDFILLDLMLPDMNGIAFLKRIKAIPKLQNIPIAILTNVPEGIPQNPADRELFKDIVAVWVKDQTTLSEIVQEINGYLNPKAKKMR